MADPKIALQIKTPRIPTYLFLDGLHESAKIAIEHVPDAQLQAVGEAFTRELIAAAAARRNNPLRAHPHRLRGDSQ